MFGNNPIRGLEQGDGSTLLVQDIFPTLQGEGPYAGWPAVFLRLGGCNLACDFCDTEFESFTPQPLAEVVETILRLSENKRYGLVVITGGEPFRQNITPLCEALIAQGFLVQIETNGTLYRPVHEDVKIICSPKNPTGKGYAPLRPDLLARLQGIKFILSERHPAYRDIGDVGQSTHNIPIYVQPMDEQDETQNSRNLTYAAMLAQQKGYRLSVQLHKLVGIP